MKLQILRNSIICLLLFLCSCIITKEDNWKLTPLGFSYEAEYSVYYSEEQAANWLDIRITNWIINNPNYRNLAYSYRYKLYDDYRIKTSYSPTGYAAGLHWGDLRLIEACVFSRITSDFYPYGMPHIRWNGTNWSYGFLPDGIGLEVVAHELDHAKGQHH